MIENIYNITIQQITYILSVVREGGFKKAADICYVTQPTLSMQIKKAEETLGYSIFDRSKNPIQLTVEGSKFVDIFREIHADYERIKFAKDNLEGNNLQRIRVGIIPTVASYLIEKVVNDILNSKNPLKIDFVEKTTVELISSLEAGRVDVAVFAGPYHHKSIRAVPLYNEEIQVYCPQMSKDKITPHDLVGLQPWLLSVENCLRTQMVNFCSIDEDSNSTLWNYEGGNIALLKRMVDLHGGYTLIPVKDVNNQGDLVQVYDSSTNKIPARSIIGCVKNKNPQLEVCLKLIRKIQLMHPNVLSDDHLILNWK